MAAQSKAAVWGTLTISAPVPVHPLPCTATHRTAADWGPHASGVAPVTHSSVTPLHAPLMCGAADWGPSRGHYCHQGGTHGHLPLTPCSIPATPVWLQPPIWVQTPACVLCALVKCVCPSPGVWCENGTTCSDSRLSLGEPDVRACRVQDEWLDLGPNHRLLGFKTHPTRMPVVGAS